MKCVHDETDQPLSMSLRNVPLESPSSGALFTMEGIFVSSTVLLPFLIVIRYCLIRVFFQEGLIEQSHSSDKAGICRGGASMGSRFGTRAVTVVGTVKGSTIGVVVMVTELHMTANKVDRMTVFRVQKLLIQPALMKHGMVPGEQCNIIRPEEKARLTLSPDGSIQRKLQK